MVFGTGDALRIVATEQWEINARDPADLRQ
jgi:hypothetical protein